MQISKENIQATRDHFALIHLMCIDDAKTGKVRVNNLEEYVVRETKAVHDALTGMNDHTFTYIQYATYIQTGICHPFLP